MKKFKGRCVVDGKWREGFPVVHLGDWVGIQIYNIEKGYYDVYQVHPETWKEVK